MQDAPSYPVGHPDCTRLNVGFHTSGVGPHRTARRTTMGSPSDPVWQSVAGVRHGCGEVVQSKGLEIPMRGAMRDMRGRGRHPVIWIAAAAVVATVTETAFGTPKGDQQRPGASNRRTCRGSVAGDATCRRRQVPGDHARQTHSCGGSVAALTDRHTGTAVDRVLLRSGRDHREFAPSGLPPRPHSGP